MLWYYSVLRVYGIKAQEAPSLIKKEHGTMAVPKQRMGRIRTHTRRSTHDRIDAPSRSVCPQCGEAKLPHRVCPTCGFYKNREVIDVDND